MNPKTRLAELEEDYHRRLRATGPLGFRYTAEGRVEGYKLALEDMAAKYEAVVRVATNINNSNEDPRGNPHAHFEALQNTLKGLEE